MKLQSIILLIVLFLFSGGLAFAQTDNNAKDLYYGKRPKKKSSRVAAKRKKRRTSKTKKRVRKRRTTKRRRTTSKKTRRRATSTPVKPMPTGLPGTKITIELQRKGQFSFVRPTYRFRSGDKIRIRMKTNFEGYVTVLNVGSSGKVNKLYPVHGGNNFVRPTDNYQIPQGNGWILFDNNPGTEIVSVIMSENKLESFDDLESNSDYFKKDRTSKNLFIQTSGNDIYAVFREPEEGKSVGFSFKLKHWK